MAGGGQRQPLEREPRTCEDRPSRQGRRSGSRFLGKRGASSSMSKKLAIVMAGGKGTRMKSELPKVLIEVCGRPMIDYVLDALEAAGVDQTVVVVGYRAKDVETTLGGRKNVAFVLQ